MLINTKKNMAEYLEATDKPVHAQNSYMGQDLPCPPKPPKQGDRQQERGTKRKKENKHT